MSRRDYGDTPTLYAWRVVSERGEISWDELVAAYIERYRHDPAKSTVWVRTMAAIGLDVMAEAGELLWSRDGETWSGDYLDDWTGLRFREREPDPARSSP